MKIILAIAVVLVTSAWGAPSTNDPNTNDPDTDWTNYKVQFNKNYSQEEEPTRKSNFQENQQQTVLRNQQYANKKSLFFSGPNEFSDMSWKDFTANMKGYKASLKNIQGTPPTFLASTSFLTVASTVNWTAKGAVTPVKSQGQCGSSWTFSATGAIEGSTFIRTGNLINLSEQNILDCDKIDTGCKGGAMQNAFNFVTTNKGIVTEDSYPYKAVQGQCAFNKAANAATVTGFGQVQQGNESALLLALTISGPIAVALDLNRPSISQYSGGIWSDPACSSTNLDHGVLLVGYGTLNGVDYWLLKNSWGTTWGMLGYFMLARNMNNMCGIATDASYPLM